MSQVRSPYVAGRFGGFQDHQWRWLLGQLKIPTSFSLHMVSSFTEIQGKESQEKIIHSITFQKNPKNFSNAKIYINKEIIITCPISIVLTICTRIMSQKNSDAF